MPRYRIPEELLAAASAHVSVEHQLELVPEEIGRPTARKDSIRLTWAEDGELGLYFICRRCPDGFDRFYLEVEQQVPSERLWRRAATHYAEAHPDRPLAPEALWHEGNRPGKPLATFMPMTPELGASIICHLCPQGMNRLFLTSAPHGDARRTRYLLSARPELREQTRGFSSREQAEYVEAIDRGVLQQQNRLAGRRALGRAAAERRPQDVREQALADLLLARAPEGRGIKQAIEGLDRLSIRDPAAFAGELATVIPGFAELVGNVAPEQLAAALASHLGCAEGTYPATSESELWKLWAAVRSPSQSSWQGRSCRGRSR